MKKILSIMLLISVVSVQAEVQKVDKDRKVFCQKRLHNIALKAVTAFKLPKSDRQDIKYMLNRSNKNQFFKIIQLKLMELQKEHKSLQGTVAGIIPGREYNLLKQIYSNAQRELQKNTEYDLFKVIQQIHDLVDEARSDSIKDGTKIHSGKEAWPEPNPFYKQTKKGLFLRGTNELWTPWGKISLTNGGCGTYWGFLSFKQQLLKKIKTKFVQIAKQGYGTKHNPEYYILKSKNFNLKQLVKKQYPVNSDSESEKDMNEVFIKVSEDKLNDMKGNGVLVTSDVAGYDSIYSIHAVENQKLPTPELLEESDYRQYKEVKKAWKAMETRYKDDLDNQNFNSLVVQ